MRRTILHLVLVFLMVVGYSGVLLAHGLNSDPELFPVFRWSLFSKVPNQVETNYGIRLLEVHGEPLAWGVYFEQSGGFGLNYSSPDASVLTQAIGAATTPGREKILADRLALFEDRFLADAAPVRYELVRRKYDVIDRYFCDCYISEEVLGEFRVE